MSYATFRRGALAAAVLAAAAALPRVAFAEAGRSAPAFAEAEPVREAFALTMDRPEGLAYDGTRLWVVDRAGGELVALEPATGRELRRIPAPGPWPVGLAWDGRLLWISDPVEGRLFGVEPNDALVVRSFESPTATPAGLGWDGEALWLATGQDLLRVSTEDGTTLSILPAPTRGDGTRPTEEVGLAWDGHALWVADRTRDRLFRIDTAEGEVVDWLPSPGPYPTGLAMVGPDLLVVDLDRRRVHRVLAGDLPLVVRTAGAEQTVEYVHEVLNQGPGTVPEAEVFVAIPATGEGQVVHGEPTFEPAPDAVLTDRYGQRVARFVARDLAPGASVRVTMHVRATLYEVRHHLRPDRVGPLRSIPTEVRRLYLGDSSKYRIDHPVLRAALAEALGDEGNPYWMVRRIYRYIHGRLHYELAGGWDATNVVLSRGSGSCSEYAMVMIAMCRAAGIPARYAGSVVVRGDDASTDDVFHRWVEVYLPGYGWVPVDPQRGDRVAPEEVGGAFGSLGGGLLVTTRGGGGSEHLGWSYNSFARWTCRGRCHVTERSYGDWRRPVP